MARENIEIVVTERGAPSVARSIEKIGDASEKSAIQTNRLKNALYGLGAATGVTVLTRLVDAYTNMGNKIRTVTQSAGEFRVVQEQLYRIANQNMVPVEATVSLYQRVSKTMQDMGRSGTETLRMVDLLNKAVGLGGSTASEAAGALLQFAQGLGANRISGQELNSILEQMPIVADAIATKLGVTRGALKKLGEQGKITAKVAADAILEMGGKWDEMFAKMTPTIEMAFTRVKNKFQEFIGGMDESLGASRAVVAALNWVASNMNIVVGAATTLATALGITLARYALDIVIGRMLDFLKLLIVGPIVGFTQAIYGLGVAFVTMGKSIGTATIAMVAFMATGIGRIGAFFTTIGAGAARLLAGFAALRAGSMASMVTAANAARLLQGAIMLLMSPLTLVRGAVVGLGTAFSVLAAGAIRAVTVGVGALMATVGAAVGMFFGLVKILAIVGVGMVTLGNETKVASDSIVTYRDVALAAWERIKVGMGALASFLGKAWATIRGQADGAFKGSGKSFFDYVRDVAKGMDMLVAGFQASYDTILDTWKSFPAALIDLIWQGLQKLWSLIVDFFSRMAKFLKESFYKIISLDFDSIGSGGLDMKVEGAAQRVADTWLDHFKRRQGEMGFFTDEVKKLEGEATLIAQEEQAKRLKIAEENKIAQDALALRGQDKTQIPGEDEKNKRKGFQDYLNELQREAQLGLAVGDAYKILNEQIEISNKLRRDLTEAERAQVAEVMKANLERERQRQLLTDINGPTTEYQANVQALTALYQQGEITLDQFNQQFFKLRENFLNGLPEATTFADGFAIQMEKMQLATRNGFGQMGTEVAKIFGPGGTLINGIGDAIAQSIVFGKSFKEQIRGIAQSILSQLIGSLVKMGLNMVMNAAMGQGLMAASTATGVASATALTAAYTPAAAMSSLATGGANAAGASTGISTVFSLLASLGGSLFGAGGMFKEGGYTGAVGVNDVAGLVHGQEFVINAAATKRHRSLLEAINAGKDPMQPIVNAAQPQPVSVSIKNEIPDAAYEVRPIGESEVEIIAKRVLRREAPDIIANDLRNPNSRTSKSLSSNTMAGRRR